MSVKSLENVRSEKALLMSQQDERKEAPINAVSFPASVLRGDPSTGKKYYSLIPGKKYRNIDRYIHPVPVFKRLNHYLTFSPTRNSSSILDKADVRTERSIRVHTFLH